MFRKHVCVEVSKEYNNDTETRIERSKKVFGASSKNETFRHISSWFQSIKVSTPLTSTFHIYTLDYDHTIDVAISAVTTVVPSDNNKTVMNINMMLNVKCVVDGVDHKLFTDSDLWEDNGDMVDKISGVILSQLPYTLAMNTKQFKKQYNIK
jgi:hypothetical protein